jgi:O-antigen/teichoic acid export membrane protein
MKQAMLAQAALVGLPLVAFSVVGTVIVRLLFGERWAGVLEIFPFLAFVYLAGTVFGPPMALLQVRGLNRELIAVTVVAVAMVFASNFVLVPQHGILGYAWSEFAGLVTCLVLPFAFRRRLGVWAVGPALCFALGIGATLFWREIGWFAVLGLAVALSVREVREELIDLLRILRTRVGWSS